MTYDQRLKAYDYFPGGPDIVWVPEAQEAFVNGRNPSAGTRGLGEKLTRLPDGRAE
jgi:hypothetical protein